MISNCGRFMAQSRRLPAGISTRRSCIEDVAQKQQFRRSQAPSDTLQTLARAGKLNKSRLKRLKSVLMFGDDVLRRTRHEVVIAKFRLDLGDLKFLLCDLPIETRLLRIQIDNSSGRQRDRFPADAERQGAGRGPLSRADRADARETSDALAPSASAIGRPLA